MGVVVRRYINFLILLIPTPLVSVLFCSSIPTFCSFFKFPITTVKCCQLYPTIVLSRLFLYTTNQKFPVMVS